MNALCKRGGITLSGYHDRESSVAFPDVGRILTASFFDVAEKYIAEKMPSTM